MARHKYEPWGFVGGAAGKTASLKLMSGPGDVSALVSKVPYHKIKAGDRLVSHGPCGGGYGDPLARDPQAVVRDVFDGFISAEAATSDYGVVIVGGQLDTAATQAARARRTGL